MSEELPPVSFHSIVLMFSAAALHYLGITPDPQTQKIEKNLPMAKQTIDTLEILKKKTKGNLDAEEEKLLDGLLYELRMHYLKAVSNQANNPPKAE
jgi:hypothetical protein|uniref:DUF1844 domain-containing protein n=1 Tax=candidate division WOR-3 bacterium TaxID=2052148 RepID=A0A7C6EC19_UNCW3